MDANQISDPTVKRKQLLHLAGIKVQEIFEHLPEDVESEMFAEGGPRPDKFICMSQEHREYRAALKRLNDYFLPKQNTAYAHLVFNLLKQKENETISDFVMRLQVQADYCDYGESRDKMIKDRLIQGCGSSEIRRELLKLGNTTFEAVFNAAKVNELVLKQERAFSTEGNESKSFETVNSIHNGGGRAWSRKKQFVNSPTTECTRCGYQNHDESSPACPAKGKQCNACGGANHFGRKCRTRNRARIEPAAKKMKTESVKYISGNLVSKPDESDDEYILCVSTPDDRNNVPCIVGNIETSAIIDCGSKYNLIDRATFEKLKQRKMETLNQSKTTDKIFKAYNGHTLPIGGVFTTQLRIGLQETTADFYIIEGEGSFLVGRDTAKSLGTLEISFDASNEI